MLVLGKQDLEQTCSRWPGGAWMLHKEQAYIWVQDRSVLSKPAVRLSKHFLCLCRTPASLCVTTTVLTTYAEHSLPIVPLPAATVGYCLRLRQFAQQPPPRPSRPTWEGESWAMAYHFRFIRPKTTLPSRDGGRLSPGAARHGRGSAWRQTTASTWAAKKLSQDYLMYFAWPPTLSTHPRLP